MTASERIRAARLQTDKSLVSALDQNPVETRKCPKCKAPNTVRSYLCADCNPPKAAPSPSAVEANARVAALGRKRSYS